MDTPRALHPISVLLTEQVATIACGACAVTATFATDDRALLVASVRAFLDVHNRCRTPVGRPPA